jgi:membrane protease YdiL (CAAX protease family)
MKASRFPAYLPHESFIAPARRAAEVWRLFPAAAVIVGSYLGLLFLLGAYLVSTYGQLITGALLQRIARGDTPGAMLLLLWTFAGLAVGPMVAVRMIHGRPAGTLFGPSSRRTIADFRTVALPVAALHVALLPLALGAEEIRPGVALGAFLGYLPFALPGLLIQTGAEELVFRGYLQQQLAARFRHPAIWMGVPSALFAWGHYLPADFGANAWAVALWAGIFGLLAADLTARTGSLGAALGFHFANNVGAVLLVGIENDLDGLALWSLSIDLSDPGVIGPALAVDFATMLAAWLVARIALRV